MLIYSIDLTGILILLAILIGSGGFLVAFLNYIYALWSEPEASPANEGELTGSADQVPPPTADASSPTFSFWSGIYWFITLAFVVILILIFVTTIRAYGESWG
ncbi:hypothetical protein [Neolewinella agarilytica]|uniref:Uncharacterized protein n=1 Tax=Neolewinella agarilytica TaxID=478744 RepID=A0A1H9K240_9BACT|nr:hypothetical protein [Neolewinella agarilytica]SEQ92895.1 hypothetical protein SAMN05444359_11940 [Neolewinella agarilytica]